MLDLEREEEVLTEAVGVDARAILSAASVSWADRFHLARERLVELAAEPRPSEADVFERDRLADYFHYAYGTTGMLARAGALLTLRDRLTRLASVAGHLAGDPAGLARLKREASILRTFARERLGRTARDAAPVVDAVVAACRTTSTYADFVAASAAIAADRGGLPQARFATTLIDGAAIVTNTPVVAAAAFVLARVVEQFAPAKSAGAWDALCDAHLASLRQELWETTEAQLARAKAPATLAAIEQADRDLELVFARLAHPSLHGSVRARVLAELYALLTAVRALKAGDTATGMLDGTLLMLAEGLTNDGEKPGSRA